MYLTDYKSNLHALTLYINLQEKINKGIPLTLVPKAEEPIKTMALPTVNSDSDTNLDQNATTWAIFEAESPPEERGRHHQFWSSAHVIRHYGREIDNCIVLADIFVYMQEFNTVATTKLESSRIRLACRTFSPN